MSPRYVSFDLLYRMQNAALNLSRKLGAAEAQLKQREDECVFLRQAVAANACVAPIGKAVACDENLNPLSVESAEDLKQSELWRMQQVAISVMSTANTPSSFAERVRRRSDMYDTPALRDVEAAMRREIHLIEKLRVAKKALVELANLGGGTSTGNRIAQDALSAVADCPCPV